MFKEKLILSCLSLAVVSTVHADYGNQQNTTYSETAISSDQNLTKKIQDKIKGYDRINVRVNNGKVTLLGYVKTESEKNKIEKEIRNIDGVNALNSQLAIQETNVSSSKKEFKQDTAATPEDNQLNKKIRDNVSRGWLWDSYKEVILNTSNGVVILEGTVDRVKDQQKLIDEIQKVEGVKSVKSHLTIKNK